jgi:gamma-butyrobetaine dioxygenase
MTVADPVALVERMFAGDGGRAYLGEAVSIAEHMLQVAARGQEAGAPAALVAAALLHDIGYLVGDPASRPGDAATGHAERGAAWLRGWLPPAVTEPVRLHVEAKRYLCATEPSYAGMLSAESARTLAAQGGPMSPGQARAFEALPFGPDAVRLRRWDEGGKAVGGRAATFPAYRGLLGSLSA